MKLRITHELELKPSDEGYHSTRAAILESIYCALHAKMSPARVKGIEILQHAVKLEDIDEIEVPEDFAISMFAEKGMSIEEVGGNAEE